MDGACCKKEPARLGPYVLAGCIGGIAGSLIAYTLWQNMLVALLAGLGGVLAGFAMMKCVQHCCRG